MKQKIYRKVKSFWHHPIRVFCLHQVNDVYDPKTCFECDWLSLQDFIRSIELMKTNYTFISLEEAYNRLNQCQIRFRNYAVLTFDDGYRSSLPALLWLENRGIPYTLFLNSKYLDGCSVSPHLFERALSIDPLATENQIASNLYMTEESIRTLSLRWASMASHGYEHFDATTCSRDEFTEQLQRCMDDLSIFPNVIPFHAYTWGKHSKETDNVVTSLGLVPVLVDGQKNVDADGFIHRELFPATTHFNLFERIVSVLDLHTEG